MIGLFFIPEIGLFASRELLSFFLIKAQEFNT